MWGHYCPSRPSILYKLTGVITIPRKSRTLPDWRSQVGGTTQLRRIVRRNSDKAVLLDTTSIKGYPLFPLEYRTNPPGYQTTDSESHPTWIGSLNKGTYAGDIGGDFYTRKQTMLVVNPQTVSVTGSIGLPTSMYGVPATETATYVGPFVAKNPSGAIFPPTPSGSDLMAKGTTAIARCKPTNNIADLALFLRELHTEGLPKMFGSTLWRSRALLARDAGEEYLNSEFGWKPMVSDIQNIVHQITHAQEVLEAYERGSHQVVRRRYEFPVEETVSTVIVADDAAVRKGLDYTPQASRTYDAIADPAIPAKHTLRTHRTWRQVWFSGGFTYHLPSDYRSRNAIIRDSRKARAILGLNLNPELLWNAMPWSWAIDWFTNCGDVISNLTDWAEDGLVLKYGYVMEHCFASYTYETDGTASTRSHYASPFVTCIETKRRLKATPFGFDVTWDGFSPRQVAISLALGLTHH